MRLDVEECRRRLSSSDHGVFGTVDGAGRAHLVPVCFAVHGERVGLPTDAVKAKQQGRLARVTHALDTGVATLLVEGWDADDWSRLWWVRADLSLEPAAGAHDADREPNNSDPDLLAAVRAKYTPYETGESIQSLLHLRIDHLVGWAAA
jgi:hypothetical protein